MFCGKLSLLFRGVERTYKEPRLNANVMTTFSFVGNRSFQTCGIGRIKVARSLRMVEVALAIQVETWLMQ